MPDSPRPDSAPPALELSYPTDYTFKAIGAGTPDFPSFVAGLISERLGRPTDEVAISVRSSGGGKYSSVSATVQLHSEEERVAVYEALWGSDRVVYHL